MNLIWLKSLIPIKSYDERNIEPTLCWAQSYVFYYMHLIKYTSTVKVLFIKRFLQVWYQTKEDIRMLHII